MVFDRFTLAVVLRTSGLGINLSLIIYLWMHYSMTFTIVMLLLLLLIQLAEFIRFVNRGNRELKKFLEAIKYEDYAVTFDQGKMGKTFGDLTQSFNNLIEKLKAGRAKQQGHSDLLNQVLEHVKTGILVVSSEGKIELMNSAAREMLNVPHFHNWEMFCRKKPEFAEQLTDFNFEGRKLIKLEGQEYYLDLARLELMGANLHLITFSDLKDEIEIKEIEAWHKLILILAHEVMNSVTPISSLSETAEKILSTRDGQPVSISDLNAEKIDDLREALKTIVRRSRGMLSFVDEYRKLTKLPAPGLEIFAIADLFEEVLRLMKNQADEAGVKINSEVAQPRMALKADRKMIEQVLINLIGNSIYALEGNPNGTVLIRAYLSSDHTIIEVIDNGRGIPEAIMPSIFIPFYSTRNDGSGIGLTLSKNIMKLHRGNIHVESKDGEGTKFRLSFIN